MMCRHGLFELAWSEEGTLSKISIAIDGPAGAGKSTIAKMIAKSLGIIYLDTGAMYRAVALKAMKNGIDAADISSLEEMVNNIDIKIYHCNEEQRILLDGVDVSDEIRRPEVSAGASKVAMVPGVRIKMVELQRAAAEHHSVVMDGRDIGTYVLPDADLKVFLTASLEERAKRRYLELLEKGMGKVDLIKVTKDMDLRDKNDSERAFAPLAKAEDAVEIDTTGMSVEEVAEKIIAMAKGKE